MSVAGRSVQAMRSLAQCAWRRVLAEITVRRCARSRRSVDLAIFHRFQAAPAGGGNQFLLALSQEFIRRGLIVSTNRLYPRTRACLFNSLNFDQRLLERLRRPGVRMVHRVDGPISVYRGRDDGADVSVFDRNRIADATVFQSEYSLSRTRSLGFEFRSPVVIRNAVDSAVFYSANREDVSLAGRPRLITTSWSDNMNKGFAFYRELDAALPNGGFEYTFVGRSPIPFEHCTVLPPIPSNAMADVLRRHDIYVTASLHEACSNAVLEALACGLPVLYVDSGANRELVGSGGLAFSSLAGCIAGIRQIAGSYRKFREAIHLTDLATAADRYLQILHLVQAPERRE